MEWFGLEGTLRTTQFQPHILVWGHLPLDQAAQSPIQPGLEHLQGWSVPKNVGQLVQNGRIRLILFYWSVHLPRTTPYTVILQRRDRQPNVVGIILDAKEGTPRTDSNFLRVY